MLLSDHSQATETSDIQQMLLRQEFAQGEYFPCKKGEILPPPQPLK